MLVFEFWGFLIVHMLSATRPLDLPRFQRSFNKQALGAGRDMLVMIWLLSVRGIIPQIRIKSDYALG